MGFSSGVPRGQARRPPLRFHRDGLAVDQESHDVGLSEESPTHERNQRLAQLREERLRAAAASFAEHLRPASSRASSKEEVVQLASSRASSKEKLASRASSKEKPTSRASSKEKSACDEKWFSARSWPSTESGTSSQSKKAKFHSWLLEKFERALSQGSNDSGVSKDLAQLTEEAMERQRSAAERQLQATSATTQAPSARGHESKPSSQPDFGEATHLEEEEEELAAFVPCSRPPLLLAS